MLLSHPRDDGLFEQIAANQTRVIDSGARTVRAARRVIRRCYPRADLYRQTGVLLDGRPTTVWFAYRDGRLSPALPTSEWWKSDAGATANLDGSGALTRASPEFRTLVGLPPVASGGEGLDDRIGPDICRELRRSARALAGRRDVTGAIELRLPWGHRRTVEFHAGRLASGDYTLVLRSLEDRDDAIARAATSLALGGASPAHRKKLLGMGQRRELGPGDAIGADSRATWAILVLAGLMRLLIRADGSEPTLAYAGHGSLLGSHVLPGDELVPIDVQAVTPSVVMQLPAQAVADLIESDGRFARAVVDQAQALYGSTALTLAARTASDLPARLAREITLLAEWHPPRGLIPVTEQQLADGVGSIRESVARTLGTFRRRGWIATTGRGLLVLDQVALRVAMGGDVAPRPALPAPAGSSGGALLA
jgi:CRP/FNR family transcriptional regulator